jgi:hypothetical protein
VASSTRFPVGAGQFLERGALGAPVVDRPQLAPPEPGRQPVGIDAIALVAVARFPMAIADHHPVDQRDEQVVEPLGLGPFLERDVYRPAHPPEELRHGLGLGGQDAPGDHPPGLRPHGGQGSCLMHIECDILVGACHESRSLGLRSMSQR